VKLPAGGGTQAFSLKGVDAASPEYRSALAKCRPVLTAALQSASKARPAPATHAAPSSHNGGPPPNIKVPAAIAAGLKGFTACMRSHGINAFPEPTGENFNLTGTGVDAASSQYTAAQTACNPILQTAFSQR